MSRDVDALFVGPGHRFHIDRELGDAVCAAGLAAFAGRFTTCVRRHGQGAAILDASVHNFDPRDAVRETVTTYRPRLVDRRRRPPALGAHAGRDGRRFKGWS